MLANIADDGGRDWKVVVVSLFQADFPPKISSPAPPLNNPIIIYTMTI